AKLQFPEVSLGIAPGSGALAVPFRRWPNCAQTFAGMILEAQPMTAQQALDNGVVSAVADSHGELLQLAIQRVHALEGVEPASHEAAVSIQVGAPAPQPDRFSPVVQAIIAEAINDAAAAPTWDAALEVGYRAFGATACTDAAREGIDAFRNKRKPDLGKTG